MTAPPHVSSMPRAGRRAFTLVELLLVVSLLGVVLTAIGACLGAGIRAWETARTFNTVESQALFGLRILRRDIMNAVRFYAVPFEGTPQDLSFLIRRPPVDARDCGLAVVRYGFNPYDRVLQRTVTPFPDRRAGPDQSEQLISKLAWITFRYGAEAGAEQRLDEWRDATNHPVRIDVEMDLAIGEERLTLSQSFVPAVPTSEEDERDE